MHANFFCADLSKQNNESLFGTASFFNHLFLLECPENWLSTALADSRLIPESVKIYLQNFIEQLQHSRILLIKKDNAKKSDFVFRYIYSNYAETLENTIQITRYDDLLKVDLKEFIKVAYAYDSQKSILVCTNGTKDKCCAKYGMALFQLLRNYNCEIDVRQCTHIGGDRFAPNVIVLPNAWYLGNLNINNTKTLVNNVLSNIIPIENYRGNFSLPKGVQGAEYFLRTKTNDYLNAFLILSVSQEDNEYTVQFEQSGKVYTVTVAIKDSIYRNYLNCHATEQKYPKIIELISFRESG